MAASARKTRIAPKSSARPALRDLIAGGAAVAIEGRLATVNPDYLRDLIENLGGRLVEGEITADVRVLILGQRDWPIDATGRLTRPLRRARVLNKRFHADLQIVSEEQLLAALDVRADDGQQTYSVDSLCKLLKITPRTVQTWLRFGLISPVRVEAGVFYFDFRQVSAARTLCELARSGVTPARLRRTLEQLAAWMPQAREPIQQLARAHNSSELLVRLADGDLAAADGQLFIDFIESSEPAPPAELESAEPSLRIAGTIGPSTQSQWVAQARQQAQDGRLADAVETYRQILLQFGTDCELVFELARVLQRQGRFEAAAERYLQCLEADPDDPAAWCNLGCCLGECGYRERACDAFRRALDLDPQYAAAHYNLADTLDELDRRAEATPHWKEYLRQDCDSPWASYARVRLAGG